MGLIVGLIEFVGWTFTLYWVHRIAHKTPYIKKWHARHHAFIIVNGSPGWHWNNLFLYNDGWIDTMDYWVTEVMPTLIFCLLTGAWWIFVFFYIWAAFFQEKFEHNQNINIPFISSGRWHLQHHHQCTKNFGVFITVWDKLFRTEHARAQ
jgi:sterol desaturase/sphingolipid hydroxylase (fatty acid hydroxylase superfamily)